MKNTKHTIIDVQKKYIANLEKQVADLEKTLENTITPDETTKKLFNLLDQLMFVAIGGSALCDPNDRKGNDLYEGVRQGMAQIFNKKIKTRFPILFKRAVEFYMLKARRRI